MRASGTDSWNDLRMERMLLLDNDELKDSDGIVHLDDSFIDIYTTGALGCYEKNVETGEVTFSPAPEYISDEEPIPYQKETDKNEDEIDSFIIPNSVPSERSLEAIGKSVWLHIISRDKGVDRFSQTSAVEKMVMLMLKKLLTNSRLHTGYI